MIYNDFGLKLGGQLLMNKKPIRKVISLLLCVVMLFTLTLPAIAEGTSKNIPVIIVTDINANPIVTDPNTSRSSTLFPFSDNDVKSLVATFANVYTSAGTSMNYLPLADAMSEKVTDMMRPIICNPDGTSKNESAGVNTYEYPLSYYSTSPELQSIMAGGGIGINIAEEIGYDNVYAFNYDWRLDTRINAGKLNEFVEYIKSETGSSKVTLISEGFGGIITSVYMSEYEKANDYANIENCVMINSHFQGLGLVGDVMTGNITFDKSGMVRYINDLPENVLSFVLLYFTLAGLNLGTQLTIFSAHLSIAMAAHRHVIYNHIDDVLRNMPGLWAMVPAKDFEAAKTFLYANKDIDPELEEIIDAYKTIQDNTGDVLKEAKDKGVKVSIVSGYNLQLFPIGKTVVNEQSDSIVDTKYSSFGADCYGIDISIINNSEMKAHREQQIEEGNEYISPDLYIDSSNCLLPDNTWFIRNMRANGFELDANSNFLIRWLALSEEQPTIENEDYPQFLQYNRFTKNLYIVTAQDIAGGYMLGDVDLDGKITAADARTALRVAAELDSISGMALRNADADMDGKISALDARLILRAAANLRRL